MGCSRFLISSIIIAKKIASGNMIRAAEKDGQATIYAAIKELEAAELIERRVVKVNSDKIAVHWLYLERRWR